MRTPDVAVVHLHRGAPPKPPEGAACNGCGVCCAWQPCPVGMLVSGRRQGRCRALRWQADGQHYRCGLLRLPEPAGAGPGWAVRQARWMDRWAGRWVGRCVDHLVRRLVRGLVARWIGAGRGCDCSLQV